MSPGTLCISNVPGQYVALYQRNGRRKVHLVAREAALVGSRFGALDWSPFQLTEGIEAFEFQTTVIAEKFMQAGNPQHDHGIVIATLNSGTLASRAPHLTGNLISSSAPDIKNLPDDGKSPGNLNPSGLSEFRQTHESPPNGMFGGLRLNNPGGFLLSHAVARAVPSAPRGLTSVFGMGTGVTLSTQPPENCFQISNFKFQICPSSYFG